MISISAKVYRENLVESTHFAKCLVKNITNKILISSNNNSDLVYPRSAIKIFQAFPLIESKAHIKFNLSPQNIAIACASHSGEKMHIKVLDEWIKKIGIKSYQLNCGIHNPLDELSYKNLLIQGNMPSELHNNCSGKHLGMVTGCLSKNMDIKNYINHNHPYQKLIRDSLENFMDSKIQKKCIGTDGCNAPQYAFSIESLTNSMINLINKKKSKSINIILSSINKFPYLIGGSNRFDSNLIKLTKGRLFCKGGAEGVLLFADFVKKIGGVIKITDGNNRAIAPIAIKLFSKLKIITTKEENTLLKLHKQKIFNHAKKKVGEIVVEIK